MKKNYEKPIAELVDFEIKDSIMLKELEPLSGQDPVFSEGVEDW